MALVSRLSIAVLLLALSVLLSITHGAAQAPISVWTRQINAPVVDIAVDMAGNLSVVGVDGQIFIRQYDPDGAQHWMRQFNSNSPDQLIGVAVDADGNSYIAGNTHDTLPGQTNAGGWDVFVRQYHSDGSEGWTRQFGTAGWDSAGGIAVDDVGTVYLVGQADGALPGQTNAGSYDAFVRQYHADGSEGWTHQFGTEGLDGAHGVAVTAAGAIYVLGVMENDCPAGYFLRQYHADGTEGWTQWSCGQNARATGIAVDWTGNIYVAGSVDGTLPGQTSAGDGDAFVMVTPSSGSITRTAPSPGPVISEQTITTGQATLPSTGGAMSM
jgi:hypothetical protein